MGFERVCDRLELDYTMQLGRVYELQDVRLAKASNINSKVQRLHQKQRSSAMRGKLGGREGMLIRVLKRLGTGGQAHVYRVRPVELVSSAGQQHVVATSQPDFALKLFNPDDGRGRQAWCSLSAEYQVRELALLAQLRGSKFVVNLRAAGFVGVRLKAADDAPVEALPCALMELGACTLQDLLRKVRGRQQDAGRGWLGKGRQLLGCQCCCWC